MGKDAHSFFDQIINWVIIPIFLFAMWLFLTVSFLANYITTQDFSFSVLSENPVHTLLPAHTSSNQITEEFTVHEDNLGVLLVRFDPFKTTPNMKIRFRIKEKGSDHWYFQSETNSIQFRYLSLYPFGFPLIKKSKGKTYVYSLSSVKPRNHQNITLSDRKPVLVTKHQYPKEKLLADKIFLLEFIQKKITYIALNSYFILASLVYLLPLLSYIGIFLFLPESKLPQQLKRFIPKYTPHLRAPYLTMIGIVGTIIFIPFRFDLMYLIFIAIWLYFARKNKLQTSITFIAAIIFMFLSFAFALIQLPAIAERAIIWSCIFIAMGTVLYTIEILKSKSAKV